MGLASSCFPEESMSTNLLPAAVISARTTHKATLIFLHGLGDDGNGWATSLKQYVPDYFKIVCPHAKSIPITTNGGMRMPAWCDVFGLDVNAKQDETGIRDSSNELSKFVSAEVNAGINPENIVIGGFSQGGAVALYNGLSNSTRYGAIVAFSTWLPVHMKFMSSPSSVKLPKEVPILQCHGELDSTIVFEIGRMTNDVLKSFQLSNCEFHSFPDMNHSSCLQELEILHTFIRKAVPES